MTSVATRPLHQLAETAQRDGVDLGRCRDDAGDGGAAAGGELGFLPGEPVQLLRRGPGGREPLAVLVGETMFALRLLEAQCIEVEGIEPPATGGAPRAR